MKGDDGRMEDGKLTPAVRKPKWGRPSPPPSPRGTCVPNPNAAETATRVRLTVAWRTCSSVAAPCHAGHGSVRCNRSTDGRGGKEKEKVEVTGRMTCRWRDTRWIEGHEATWRRLVSTSALPLALPLPAAHLHQLPPHRDTSGRNMRLSGEDSSRITPSGPGGAVPF